MSATSKTKDRGITLRAILISLFLILVNNYWITVIEVRWYALDGTCLPIFITPVFILFILAALNLGVKSLAPAYTLRSGELITIYMMVVMGATLASHDLIQNLFGAIGHANYFNTDGRYSSFLSSYLPSQLFVSDPAALKGFYRGGVDPWNWSILQFWLIPLLSWGGLMAVLIGMMMCLSILIRRQWTEHEKLVFPLIQLPIEMAAEDSGRRLYANKLMWAGFGIAFAIGVINGLHVIYPTMPFIQGVKQFDLASGLTERPWNAIARGGNGFKIAAYPFGIGLAYFIPLDLSFSCWFFYLLRKLWQVVGAAMGWDSAGSGFPYYESQSSGAWLALAVLIIAGSMPHLKSVWKKAWSADGSAEDLAEGALYRKCFVGLIVGTLLLFVFARWIGMAGWVALLFFGIYFLIAIALTRVRAELGTPHEIYFVNPQQIMVSVLGYNVLGPANLTLISVACPHSLDQS